MKHLEVCRKYSAVHRIFNSLLSISCIWWWNTASHAYLNNPILSHNWGVPSRKYELTAEITSGNVAAIMAAPAWAWALVNQFQKHFLSSLLLDVLQSSTQGFQSKIEEENMTQRGWYLLCKNESFLFFFFRGFSLIIFLNLMLAFVEKPSSFTWVPKKVL